MDAVRGGLDSVILVAPRCFSMRRWAEARAAGSLAPRVRPPRESNRALNTESEHTMQVACGPLAAAPAMSRANVASARRPAGGLLPARRAVAPLRARRVVAPMRRAGAVAVSASLGEFPAWDAAADVARDVHATIVTNDAVSQLFQIADAAPAEDLPGLQKGGWLGPITDLLESILKVRADPSRPPRALPAASRDARKLAEGADYSQPRARATCPNPNPARVRVPPRSVTH